MSPQIQRLRMRLLRFDFSLITADTLFRAPVARQDDQYRTEEEIDLYVQHVSASLSASNTQFERIREKQEDEVCQTLRQYCNEGWPDSTRVPDALKPYWQTKDDPSVVHGLLLKAERIVIPNAISLEMALLYAFAYKRAIKVLRNAEKERKGRCGGQVYWTKN